MIIIIITKTNNTIDSITGIDIVNIDVGINEHTYYD